MLTTISADGVLKIQAETELEAYALKKWSEDNCIETAPEFPSMLLNFNLPENT